jgi:hypothetical protein
MEKKQYYSIRKHKKGAVSVLLFTALFAVVGAGSEASAADSNPSAADISGGVTNPHVSHKEKEDEQPLISDKTKKIVTDKAYNESGKLLKNLNNNNLTVGKLGASAKSIGTGSLITVATEAVKEKIISDSDSSSEKFVKGVAVDLERDMAIKAITEGKKINKDMVIANVINNSSKVLKDEVWKHFDKIGNVDGRKIILTEKEINNIPKYKKQFEGLDILRNGINSGLEIGKGSGALNPVTASAQKAYTDINVSLGKTAITAIDRGFDYMFDLINKSRIEAQNNNRDLITDEQEKSELEKENDKVFSKKPIKAWEHGSKEGLVFEIEKELGDFKEAQVNGVPLDSSNYNLSKGSTIVNLKPEYLDKLHEGRYTLGAIFKKNGEDDYVTTTFDIKRKGDTNKISEKDGIYIVQDLKDLTENNKTDITDTEVKNEVSLVIDTSLSMINVLDQVKEMAKKTVESILKNSNTKINLVGFSAGAGLVVESTNDKQKLFEGIDSLIPFIGTNFYSALEVANESFITNAPNKSIIFMTDGIPGDGKEEDDDNLFNEKEHGESARFANAAVHLKESFKGKYDIYPIGFINFPEEHNKEKEFAKRLLEKLATKKVYMPDNLEELSKVFENVAKDVVKKFDFELGHKLVAKTPEKLVYKLTETVLNPNESDLTKIQTELKLLNQGKVIAPTSVQTIDVISKQGRAVFEWLIELNRKDFKETDKLNFEVITSTSEKLKAAKKAYFNIDNKVTKYEVDRSKIEEIIKDEIEKGKVNVKEILLKELENEAKSEPSESKKGEPLIQPENPKYEIPTDKNIEEPKVGTIAKENTHKENLPPKENTVTFKSNEKENVKAPVLLDSKENKVIAKETKTLPNTGTSSQSTTIIGLISAAVALRLRKKAE